MSSLISSDRSKKESHDENDRQPLSQPPPTKPPLSSSFNSAALAVHRQHSPLERRSSSVLANRTARSNSQLIRSPIETYLPSLQIVYGQSVAGSDEARVMSEKVQMLAASIYKELERMIQKNGEESVKELMPLVVNVLESLDLAYLDKDEHVVEVEMLKEENEQLLNQYEREKQMRKSQNEKYLEQEELLTEHSKILEEKMESVESKLRTTELRLRNANDHIQRFEEHEAEQKTEYEKLHERYNELLRTHIDVPHGHGQIRNGKILLLLRRMQSLPPGHRTDGMAASVDANVRGITDIISAAHMSQSTHAGVNLANHISAERDYHDEFGQATEDLLISGREEGNPIVEELEQHLAESHDDTGDTTRSGADQEGEDDGLAAQLTGALVDPSEFASAVNDSFLGMGREVDNLIKENTELLETKNALNIVKNDLIAQLDQLSNENEVFREELRTIEMVKVKQGDKIRELELELKSIKEKLAADEQEEQDIPMAQRKRFTRVEMARVLMERNQFKEKLMELQETMKYTEMQRQKKLHSAQAQNKSRIWDFFSGLFGDAQPVSNATPKRPTKRSSSTVARKQIIRRNFDMDDSVVEKRMADRRQQYKNVSEHMKKEDETRTRAYGWSIPATIDTASTTSIPVPVCCRPLLDQQPSLKIWCATGTLLHGGLNTAEEYIIGDSIFYADPLKGITEKIDSTIASKVMEERAIWESSSLVWVGSSNEKRSYVTIFDANNSNCILECFPVLSSHLLCISSVAGIRECDHILVESKEQELVRNGGYQTNFPADIGANEAFGQVSYVKMRSSDVDNIPTFCSEDEKASPKRSRDFSVSEPQAETPTDENSEAAAIKKNIAKRVGFEILNDPSDATKCTPLEKSAVARSDLIAPPAQQPTESSAEKLSSDEGKRNLTAYANLPPHIRDALSKYDNQGEMGTALPTVWMGLENDFIVIHSAVLNWREYITKDVFLPLLANGSIAVFHRAKNGRWSTDGYHVIRLGQTNSSVCNLTIVHDKIWVAYRNCVAVLNPDSLLIEDAFVAHPRRDSQVRHMVWAGNGVWISIRLDSTLRLYQSRTMQHLQDIDIEPYLSQMLGSTKMDFLHLRITSLIVLNRKLWVGTGTGVVICIPLSNENAEKVDTSNAELQKSETAKTPGSLIRVYNKSTDSDSSSSDKFIPYCNISMAQFSFHGHKDSVRFFVCVPSDGVSSLTMSLETRKLLMISGGDGYLDFRLGEDDPSVQEGQKNQVRAHDLSNIIVWEVDSPNPYKAIAPAV
ncbi:JNK-interacting protein 3 [Aphelenchoides bicaudatus]|nr:JNK-interacting protein 3 [Aphelenchoides bicaudatus]